MKISLVLNSFILITTLFLLNMMNANASLPFLVSGQDGKVEQVEVDDSAYVDFIDTSIKNAAQKTQAKNINNDFEVNYVVIGMATDVRVGFWSWNLSASSAVEFHMKVLK